MSVLGILSLARIFKVLKVNTRANYSANLAPDKKFNDSYFQLAFK